jgi:hypothetical protein
MVQDLLSFLANLTPSAAIFVLALGAVIVAILALYTVLVVIKDR